MVPENRKQRQKKATKKTWPRFQGFTVPRMIARRVQNQEKSGEKGMHGKNEGFLREKFIISRGDQAPEEGHHSDRNRKQSRRF